jgi:hypothetical protein
MSPPTECAVVWQKWKLVMRAKAEAVASNNKLEDGEESRVSFGLLVGGLCESNRLSSGLLLRVTSRQLLLLCVYEAQTTRMPMTRICGSLEIFVRRSTRPSARKGARAKSERIPVLFAFTLDDGWRGSQGSRGR